MDESSSASVAITEYVACTAKISSFAGTLRVLNLQSSVKFIDCNKYDAAL